MTTSGDVKNKRSRFGDRVKLDNTPANEAIDRNDFEWYQQNIVHSWLQIITALTFVLVPLFFVLDIVVTPSDLLLDFGIFRASSTIIALAQYLVVRHTRPHKYSFLHGYFVSLHVGGVIALMTVYLGGFQSGYYVGLIMVIIGANLLMPWHAKHTAINVAIIIGMYVSLNLIFSDTVDWISAANNLFFLLGTSIISVAINHVRYSLIQTEFSLLVQLKQARDALWSEMELAKQVQTALLPQDLHIQGYEISVTFEPAKEVGGDYYDVIQTPGGSRYIAIGDVAGHGLDSGLIMMMAQTAVMTVVQGNEGCSPSEVLQSVNAVLRENIQRLGANHYMTMTVIKLEDDTMHIAGHHQDIIVYRHKSTQVETLSVYGSWLGITDDISGYAKTTSIPMAENDAFLLFSDGVTEANSESRGMFGQSRLTSIFQRTAASGPRETLREVRAAVTSFQTEQDDDMTMIMVKKTSTLPPSQR